MVSVVCNDGVEPAEEKRNKVAARLTARGYCTCKAFAVAKEYLPKLEQRLDEIEKLENQTFTLTTMELGRSYQHLRERKPATNR